MRREGGRRALAGRSGRCPSRRGWPPCAGPPASARPGSSRPVKGPQIGVHACTGLNKLREIALSGSEGVRKRDSRNLGTSLSLCYRAPAFRRRRPRPLRRVRPRRRGSPPPLVPPRTAERPSGRCLIEGGNSTG